MKTMKKTWMAILALACILCLSISVLAETAAETTENPAVTENAPVAEETAPQEAEQSAEDALTEAYEAYAKARKSARKQARLDALKTELDGYVAAGSMTQEQADLILKDATEQSAAQGTKNNRRGHLPGNGQSGQMRGKGGRNAQPGQVPGNGGWNVQPGQMPGMGNCNPGMQNSGNGMMPRNNTGRGSRSFPQMNQGQSGL